MDKPKPVYCFVAIQDQKILLVQKEAWILPGGKPETVDCNPETAKECIVRENKEELPGIRLDLDTLVYLNKFPGKAPRKGYDMCAYVYFVDVTGEIMPNPDSEISDSMWTSYPEKYNLSESTRDTVKWLRKHGYLPKLKEA